MDAVKVNSNIAHKSEKSIGVEPNTDLTGAQDLPGTQDLRGTHDLRDKWDLYYHLPQNKKWDLESYCLILEDIDNVEKLVVIGEALTVNVMKYCMLFVMRAGIAPMWEDAKNRKGGFFSYKVANKFVPEVWKTMFYALCGETLSSNPKYSHLINGITVSPKKSFCIIKIWMTDMSMQDGSVIIDIPNLTKHGVAFKAHKPEF
jgi:hypothetical protein